MRKYFEFQNGVKINCGENALGTISAELTYYGSHAPLMLTSANAEKLGVTKKVRSVLSVSDVQTITLREYPSDKLEEELIRELKNVYDENECDGIIAVGGDVVLDAAKCLRLFLAENCNEIVPIVGVGTAKAREIPMIAIPTENGSGKEASGFVEYMDSYVTSRALIPNVVIIDEEVSMAAPARTVAACGVYALANAIEAYLNVEEESPIEIYAEKTIRLLSKHLETALENGEDEEACRATALAATLSGVAYGEAPYGHAHALAKALSDVTGEPIEEMYGIVLGPTIETARKSTEKRVKNLLLAIIGAEEYAETPASERSQRTVNEIAQLLERLHEKTNIPIKISQTKIQREDFGKIAEAAANTREAIYAYRPITKDEFLSILNAAY